MSEINTYKVIYIHGRPSGHPIHDAYAKALNADFIPVDFKLKWHEDPNSSRLKRYFSWIVCALLFPKKNYSVFFTESVREPLLIMKFTGLLNSRQKLIPLMDNETLYFYHNKRYSKIVMWMIRKYLERSDAIICVGDFQTQLAKQIIPESNWKKIKTVNNWVFPEKVELLSKISPDLASNKIVFIGDVSAEFRAWYKGVDLMIKAFAIAAKENSNIILEMIGINDETLLERYLKDIPEAIRRRIIIKKRQPIFSSLEASSLYLHCARGEAWGITIMEALTAGVPVICSDLTGAKEVVEKVSPELIVTTNEQRIAEKILWFYNLSIADRKKLSVKGRMVMAEYSEERSLAKFQKIFTHLMQELYA